jgi:hypothetical protein
MNNQIGETDVCTCGTAEHLLQTCPTYSNERKNTWQHLVLFQEKLYGDAGNLELAAAFFRIINVNV